MDPGCVDWPFDESTDMWGEVSGLHQLRDSRHRLIASSTGGDGVSAFTTIGERVTDGDQGARAIPERIAHGIVAVSYFAYFAAPSAALRGSADRAGPGDAFASAYGFFRYGRRLAPHASITLTENRGTFHRADPTGRPNCDLTTLSMTGIDIGRVTG